MKTLLKNRQNREWPNVFCFLSCIDHMILYTYIWIYMVTSSIVTNHIWKWHHGSSWQLFGLIPWIVALNIFIEIGFQQFVWVILIWCCNWGMCIILYTSLMVGSEYGWNVVQKVIKESLNNALLNTTCNLL